MTGTRLEQIQARLPSGSALLEFRIYHPMNVTTGTLQEPRWLAALILPSTEEPSFVLKDLGPVQRTLDVWKQWQDERPQHTPEAVSDALYEILFRPFSSYLTQVQTMYIAPDSFLHLVPLEQLRVDGQYWIERQDLRRIQTGRDLVREPSPRRAEARLVAFGGIDFAHHGQPGGDQNRGLC